MRLRATYPMSRYFAAFDGAVAAAGYNAYHELIELGVPSLFVPMPRDTDDQAARARYAERRRASGSASTARRTRRSRRGSTRLLDPGERAAIADRARRAAAGDRRRRTPPTGSRELALAPTAPTASGAAAAGAPRAGADFRRALGHLPRQRAADRLRGSGASS